MKHLKLKKIRNINIVKRLFVSLLLSAIFILPITTVVQAAVIEEEDIKEDSSGILETNLSKTILSFANTLIRLTGAQDIAVLVFQQPAILEGEETLFNSDFMADKEQLVYGIFPKGIYSGIEALYTMFNSAIPTPIIILLTISGFSLLFDVLRSSGQRSQIKSVLIGLIFAVIAMQYGPTLWGFIIGINDIVVSGVYTLLEAKGIHVTSFISTVWNAGTSDVFSAKNLGVALIVFCACFTTFLTNYQYMIRMISIGALIIMFPIVVILLVLPSKRSSIGQWISLFASNVFLQTAHALAFALFFFFLKGSTGFDFWIVLAMFFGLPAVVDLINRIISWCFGEGFGGGPGTTLKNMSGMSSLLGVAALGKSIMGGNSNASTANSGKPKAAVDSNFAQHDVKSGNAPSVNAPVGDGFKSQQSPSGDNLKSATNENNSQGMDLKKKGMEYQSQTRQNNAGTGFKSRGSSQHVPIKQRAKNAFNEGSRMTGQAIKAGSRLTGTGIVRTAQFAKNSKGLKMNAKRAAMIAAVGAGAAMSTMVTGKGQSGAALGYMAGKGINKVGGEVADKVVHGAHVGGEVLQSKGEGKEAFANTKERIGYKDSSQLANPAEVGRMSKELFGNGGQKAGEVASQAYRRAGENGVQRFGKLTPEMDLRAADKKERLEQQHLPQVNQDIAQQRKAVQAAEKEHHSAIEQRTVQGKNPQTQQRVEQTHAKLQEEKFKLAYKESQEQKMQARLVNFYDLEKTRKEAQKLRRRKAE